ncbi:molybdenum cofactor guanylyltransferase [Paenibacillus sp. GP183]|jgi:molybdopterin-guanine dinucleotide biosynthesis protein A|uniref:molybdenum cofactor guanylyltransferase n=1 Tax=Paenibacillus sp. GP183 TaxID=1882751 RepID=UPI00089BDA3E|nr:molybdenum cofactor guanylyltransferase [Paenibacillus sp. GP183]SEC63528.1 molybdenum cofactor guanylyltransferase [Paenibacillus sp. GP183]
MMTGVILAGGQNRRMGGKHKALIPFRGVPLLNIQLQEMARICKQILLVTHKPELFAPILQDIRQAEVSCIPDVLPGKGPLSGIHAACLAAETNRLWIVGCDMPYVSAAAAEALYDLSESTQADAVIPVIHEKVQPLHGIYDKRIAPVVSELLGMEQFKLMGLLARIHFVTADDLFFAQRDIALTFTVNLNTPDDFLSAE